MAIPDEPTPSADALPQGFCELELSDYVTSEFARFPAFDRVFMFVLGVSRIVGEWVLTRTLAPFDIVVGVWMIWLVFRLPHYEHRAVARIPASERRTTFVPTPEALILRTESGSVQQIGWRSVEYLVTEAGLALCEIASGKLIPIPRRAWPGPPSDFARVRALVLVASKQAEVPKIGKVVRIVVVVLIVSVALRFVK